MKTIFLYGIGGPIDHYRVIRYTKIDEEDWSILTFKYEADIMRARYPGIKRVFAMDVSRALSRSYMECIKKNSIESCMVFRDILERQGVEII